MMRSVLLPLLIASTALAAPQVNNVSTRGIQIGQTVTLTFDGVELAGDTKIASTLPLKSQQIQPDATANRVAIQIVVDEAAQPGIYALRLVSDSGISNPVLVAVDSLPQEAFGEQIAAIPVAVSGAINGSEVKKTTFAGTKGQRIVIDVEAQRLGANFKPILRLYDARGRQLAFAASQPWFGGDARCQAILPDDGNYTIELHDRLYRAAAPGMFRLKVGDLATADRVHPAAITAGGTAKLGFVGGALPPEAAVDFSAAQLLPGDAAVPFPALPWVSGPRPNLAVSDHAEVVEQMVHAGVQEVSAPNVGISGVLSAANEEDKFALAVTPGQRLKVQMFARSLGSPIDGVLAIRNEQGGQLATADDVPGSPDPLIAEFTVPADVNKIVVAVKDLVGHGGAECNYRVVIRDLALPHFNLSIATDRLLLPAGGTQLLQVPVDRQSYAGPIKLEFPGLPETVQVQGAEIAAGSPLGLVTFTAPAGVASGGLFTLVGRGGELVRTARGPALAGSELAPYLRDALGWGVAAASPLNVAWVPTAEPLVPGSTPAATVQITRAANVVGPVRVKLLTTQPNIKKTIKVDDKDQEVDDLDRLLRLEADTVIPAEMSEATVKVFVPGDLPVAAWDTILVAELLSADSTNVVATAYAPAHRFTSVAPPATEAK